ncbi:MAG: RloB family protein [Coprobacillus sp.]
MGNKNWKNARKQGCLELKKDKFYIFCEGEKTEPLYFEGFKNVIENNPVYKNTILLEIEPCATDTLRVLKKAEEYVKRNHITDGQIWCVYDKDSFPKDHFNAVEERIMMLNQQSSKLQYFSAWSNECIEIWFILHFDNYVSNNHRSEYINYLNKKLKSFGLNGYRKNSSDIFSILNNQGNPKLAIRYAKRLINENNHKPSADIAPGTKVYDLVERLSQYLPESLKNKYI